MAHRSGKKKAKSFISVRRGEILRPSKQKKKKKGKESEGIEVIQWRVSPKLA